ncbi:cupin domain-containing protein [Virgibacillus dakarensis]|uniref:DNA-binding protein n=1 Tax=Lentibacillus populi TaxID=1827502 RepID=A0A9W5TYH0_9BACI|nr:cupin domain-containing protein [Lentibacillus populi]MTW87212.1 cupin domain-containing protein [Virgibacillus dakarensis]GGB48123.1 DNA-binding protein [Lentibacillus populi]
METVYKKIKNLRAKNNITLAQLSEKTGLSISFLSQIEKGTTNLAITSLKKIADAYHISMKYFFDEEDNPSYITSRVNQKRIKIEGMDEELIRLNGQFKGREMDPFHVTVLPNTTSTNRYTHQGEEFYYVLQGEITFIVEEKTYVVGQGEAIHFPSYLPHDFENRTNEKVELLNVVTPSLL